MEQITKFLNPLFSYLESGKLFRQPLVWLYYLIGVASCIAGIKLIIDQFDGFSYHLVGAEKVYAILMAIVLLALCIFSLLFWFRRAVDLKDVYKDGSDWIAMPIVANLVRTFGEWLGFVLGIFCVCGGVLTIIFLSANQGILPGLVMLVGGAIVGYLIILLSRYAAEMIMVRVAIANNTKNTVSAIVNK